MPSVTTPFNSHTGKRNICEIAVKCSNVDSELECDWQGTIGTLDAHKSVCHFSIIPCPKKCSNNKNEIVHFMRKDLDNHLEVDCPQRDHKCERCGEMSTFVDITTLAHDEVCKKKPLSCPNTDCSEAMPREEYKRHIEECSYAEVPCKYRKVGCEAQILRKDISAHEDKENRSHLHMVFNRVLTKEDVQNLIAEASNVNSTNGLHGNSLMNGHVCKFIKFQEDLSDNYKTASSPDFYVSPGGYYVRINASTNITDPLKVSMRFLKGKYDDTLEWPVVGKITCQLLNHLEDKNHHVVIKNVAKEDGISISGNSSSEIDIIGANCSPELDFDRVKNTHYLKEDTLYISVTVDISDHSGKPWLIASSAIVC